MLKSLPVFLHQIMYYIGGKFQVPLCLAVEDLWRVKIRARMGEDAQYWYAHLKVDHKEL